MALIETEGLVLRKYNLSDADRIVLVLTETHGLIRGVANGAKRLKSKFSGSLEFFSRIGLTYFQKEDKDLVILRDSDLVETVFDQTANPDFFNTFAEIADLLIRTTPPYEPNKRLYHMTRHCLASAVADERFLPAVRVYFEIWLLKLGGFLPSWERCAVCDRELAKEDEAGLNLDFQLVCSNCDRGLGTVGGEAREIFGRAQSTSPTKFSMGVLENTEALAELREIVGRISDAVLERMPASVAGRVANSPVN